VFLKTALTDADDLFSYCNAGLQVNRQPVGDSQSGDGFNACGEVHVDAEEVAQGVVVLVAGEVAQNFGAAGGAMEDGVVRGVSW